MMTLTEGQQDYMVAFSNFVDHGKTYLDEQAKSDELHGKADLLYSRLSDDEKDGLDAA